MKLVLNSEKKDAPQPPYMLKFDLFSFTMTLKLWQGHPNLIKSLSCPTAMCIYMQIWSNTPTSS